MEFLKVVFPMAMACLCNTVANTLFKIEFSSNPFNPTGIISIIKTFLSVKILIGVAFYGLSMLIFFYSLSRYKMSIVVTLTSLTYVFNFVVAFLIFKEKISINSILGGAVILMGLLIISGNSSVHVK